MRQGQQNRRGRGRHNNNNNHSHSQNQNRKGQNPLTRSYESNGPEVKIRGNPAHIAEKYISLARDAQTSGDPVLAENYLQHAEHYNRIIMAFREQQVQQGGDMGGGQRFRPNQPGEAGDDFAEGDAVGSSDAQIRGQEPQPPMFEAGAQDQQHGQPPAQDNPREHRGQRYDDRGPRRHGEQGYRQEQQGRPHRDRYDPQRASHQDRSGSPEAAMADQAGAGGEGAPNGRHDGGRRRERFNPGPQHEQPEFLRRPVRRPRREGGEDPPGGDDRD